MTDLGLFLVGVYVSMYKVLVPRVIKSLWIWVILVLMIVLALCMYNKTGDAMPIHIVFNYVMIALFLLLLSLHSIKVSYKSILGKLSFPIYLVHHKVIMASVYLGHILPVWVFVLVTIYLGYLLQKTIEARICD